MIHSIRLVAAVLAAGVVATADARAAQRAVAVTFDDLPATSARVAANDVASLRDMTRRLLRAAREHGVPAVGFVNEGKLFVAATRLGDLEGRTGLLRMWLDAGLELGNHTYSHPDLNRTPLKEFEADVMRGEKVTRKLLEERGRTLRYFRHPFVHVGSDLPKRRAFEAFLAAHGYVVAPVTVDDDDYIYAAVYANALRRGDRAAAARIGDDYLRYMDEVFSFFEGVSRRIVGREIRQVVLLHANTLNADRFGAVAEALADDAYRRPDEFVGAPGNSWLNHWAVTAGGNPIPTPAPAEWILKAYRALSR
jgi:peptidoglycan/xylan/chitin deacetylase (PgdA/CDA1 family)